MDASEILKINDSHKNHEEVLCFLINPLIADFPKLPVVTIPICKKFNA